MGVIHKTRGEKRGGGAEGAVTEWEMISSNENGRELEGDRYKELEKKVREGREDGKINCVLAYVYTVYVYIYKYLQSYCTEGYRKREMY